MLHLLIIFFLFYNLIMLKENMAKINNFNIKDVNLYQKFIITYHINIRKFHLSKDMLLSYLHLKILKYLEELYIYQLIYMNYFFKINN